MPSRFRRRLVVLGAAVTALAVARNAQRLGLEAIVADSGAGIAFSSRAARPVLLNGDHGDCVDQIAELGRTGWEPCLLATSDAWLRFVRRERSALEPAFCRILHPANGVLDACLDKVAFGQWCDERGFRSPRCGVVGLRPPLLIRPRWTLHDEPRLRLPKAVEARTDDEVATWLARFASAGVEAAVSESLLGRPLEQLSVALARRDGETIAYSTCKVRPGAEDCAAGTYVVSRRDATLEALGRRMADALGLEGMAEVEVLRDRRTGEDFVIEANLRPWSQYSMAAALGMDFLGFVLGMRPARSESKAAPVAWMDLTGDLHAMFSRTGGLLSRGKVGWRKYLSSVLEANTLSTLDWRDPGPFVEELRVLLQSRPGSPPAQTVQLRAHQSGPGEDAL